MYNQMGYMCPSFPLKEEQYMQYQILKEPMAILDIHLDNGETITAEAGAMVYMQGDIEIKTKTREGGGFLKKLKVSVLGGQSFFVNNYVANMDGCSMGLTGGPIGDIAKMEINPEDGLIVHSGAYIASTSDVILDTQWQGFTKGLFGSELFMLKANGIGDLFLNTFGAIVQKDLQKDERMIIDNHHIVALSENSNYTVRKFGGLKSTLLGGEGLVTEIIGPGSVYFQTKNINDFVDYLGIKEMIEKASSSSDNRSSGISLGGFKIGT
jgi:uncharacterized protein (TIGR00266 family)